MKIKFISLASGSSGNCYFLGTDRYGILVDAGIGIRTIKKTLKELGIGLDIIRAVFITHDHADHIKAVGHLGEKFGIPVYSTPEVHAGINKSYCMTEKLSTCVHYLHKGETMELEDFAITAFEVPHDGTDNVGYCMNIDGKIFSFLTDLGHITPTAAEYICKANYLVLEANYDEEMLKMGPYPQYLKERIAGPNGHMSNRETADFLAENINESLKYIWLCHLSKDNNHPELAYKTVELSLRNKGVIVGKDVQVIALKRNTPSDVYEFEYIICAFGKKLGVKMAETYKIYIDNNYMGIISEGIDKVGDIKYDASDLIKLRENNPNNFPIDTSGYDKIINEYKNLSNPNNIKMIGDSNYIVLDTTEDIEKAISLFPKIMSLFQISDEQKQKIEQDYFNMLVLDSVIGNVDRVMDNYGVVQRKNGKIEFSPLFDNATITIPDIPQQYAKINSYLIDKSRIMDVLYEKYYDKIKPITSQILEHRDEYYKFIKDISQKELNESEQRWFVEDTFNKNLDRICERERKQQLEVMPHQVQPQQFNKPKVKTLTRNSNDNSSGSKGFADAITLSLMVGFMCGILFIIVYILIKR